MKKTFCDICFRTRELYRESTYRIWYNGKYEKIRLDVCNEHRDFFKDCSTYEIAHKKVRELKVKE